MCLHLWEDGGVKGDLPGIQPLNKVSFGKRKAWIKASILADLFYSPTTRAKQNKIHKFCIPSKTDVTYGLELLEGFKIVAHQNLGAKIIVTQFNALKNF